MPEPSRQRPPVHIFVYGPPAAGKLTVAHALAGECDLKVLDNHVPIDAALRLFRFGSREWGELVDTLWADMLSAAAKAGLDVVSTLVYMQGVGEGRVRRLRAASEAGGAVVHFIRLCPNSDALERRVTDPSRSGSKKIQDPAQLRRMAQHFNLDATIDPTELSIDNSDISAVDVARQIANVIGLAEVAGVDRC